MTVHVTDVNPADLTANGFVDFEDLTVLLANWNQNVSAAEGNLVDATCRGPIRPPAYRRLKIVGTFRSLAPLTGDDERRPTRAAAALTALPRRSPDRWPPYRRPRLAGDAAA